MSIAAKVNRPALRLVKTNDLSGMTGWRYAEAVLAVAMHRQRLA